ncbi:MAG TPA: hypothetical protein VIL09_17715 [Microvirga sp.]|jgi:hypothetical protein
MTDQEPSSASQQPQRTAAASLIGPMITKDGTAQLLHMKRGAINSAGMAILRDNSHQIDRRT